MGGATLTTFTAASALLVAAAGAARLRDADPDRRLLGGVLLCAALAALAGLVPGPRLAGLGVAAVHAVLVTAAASLGFAVLRRVTQDPTLACWRPGALGAVAWLLQVVVLAMVASQPQPITPPALPALLTAAWPAATTVLAVSTLRAVGAFAPRALRAGMALALVGCAAIGAGTALGIASAVTVPAHDAGRDVLAAISGSVGAAGLLLLGAGVTIPGLAQRVRAVRRWVTAVRVLRRARPLVQCLAEVAGEWAPPWGTGRLPLRHPVEQAYGILIFVRDASFTLHPLVDPAEQQAARQHARRHARGGAVAVEALTDACWLALAIARRRAGRPALLEQDSVFLDQVVDDAVRSAASVSAELAFLGALARAWVRTGVTAEFVETMTADAQRLV